MPLIPLFRSTNPTAEVVFRIPPQEDEPETTVSWAYR